MKKRDQASSQKVLLVDSNDKFLSKYVARHEAHTGEGIHHRAFVCFLLNKKGEILLQKRKHWLWDGLWDLSAISHVLHLDGHDESYEEATARALKKEMGIEGVETKKLGGFNYFAKHEKDEGLPRHRRGCEDEYCAIMFGRYDGPVEPNDEDIYEYKWTKFTEFIKETKNHPEKYTPWAVLTVENLKKIGYLGTNDIINLE